MPVPFWKLQLGRGKPFACKACGTILVVPRIGWPGILFAMTCLAVANFVSLGAAILMLVVYSLVDWKLGPVRRA